MYRKYLNARSPMRLLEKGLHGGLGKGNLGVVLAGAASARPPASSASPSTTCCAAATSCTSRSTRPSVNHVRAFYDTVFAELTSSTHLKDAARERAEVDRRRSIRTYTAPSFSAAKLREAVKFEAEAGAKPELVIVEGFDVAGAPRDELLELRVLAGELRRRDLALGVGSRRARARAPGSASAARGRALGDPRPRAGRRRAPPARPQGPRQPRRVGAPRGPRPDDAAAEADVERSDYPVSRNQSANSRFTSGVRRVRL